MNYCNRCFNWYNGGFCSHCMIPSHPCTPQSSDPCGCLEMVSGKCTYYNSATTSCLGITKGTTYDQIIGLIDTKLCTIGASAVQRVYNVLGTSGQIVSTGSVVGNNTTYTLSLDPAITNHLVAIDAEIDDLQACCNASIKTITTNTPSNLIITNPSAGVTNIDYASTGFGWGGIVSNDINNVSVPSNTTGYQVSGMSIDFASKGATTFSEIVFRYSFQLGIGDAFAINFFNNSSTVFYSIHMTSTIDSTTSWTGTTIFNMSSTTSAVVDTEIHHNFTSNEASPLNIDLGVTNKSVNGTSAVRAKVLSGIDLSDFQYEFLMDNNNFVQNAKFGIMVSELIKKLP